MPFPFFAVFVVAVGAAITLGMSMGSVSTLRLKLALV